MTEPMKTAEDYWYEFSNHSTGTITEAQFKAAIRRCQQDEQARIRQKLRAEVTEDYDHFRRVRINKIFELIDSL